jgi:hypothetical protein
MTDERDMCFKFFKKRWNRERKRIIVLISKGQLRGFLSAAARHAALI